MGVLLGLVLCASAPARQPIDAFEVTGRDFAGTELPLQVSDGVVIISATSARVWTESGPLTRKAGARPVQRLLLEGDVRLTLGYQQFRARRAAVWIQRLPQAEGPGEQVYQVHAYLDQTFSAQDDSLVSISAGRLPLEGVVRVADPVRVSADLVLEGREEGEFLRQAELDFAQRLRRRLGMPLYTTPGGDVIDERLAETPAELQRLLDSLQTAEHRDPIFAASGTISFSYGELTVVSGEDENSVLITGGVTLLYEDLRKDRSIEMRAQRAVLFLDPGPVTGLLQTMSPESLHGLYLEGEVLVTDGDYTLRGPRVFYDVANDRAIVLDAVLFAYDDVRRIPLYVRADAIRQESADQFSAEKATVAISSFAEPHLSLGARELTLTRRPHQQGADRYFIQAHDMVLRGGGVPFFYLPFIQGDPERMPITRLGFDSADGSGFTLRTGWDFESLFGIELPGGTDAELLIDAYFARGAGLGLDVEFNEPNMTGSFQTYWLIDDFGEDRLHTGQKLGHDGDTRGMILFDQRWALDERWTMWLEASYFSDETFVDGLFESLGNTRRPFMTGGYLQRLEGNTAFTLDARGQLNDFSVNEFALQTPGYVTEHLPEVSYHQQAIDLLADSNPGLFTLSSEYRVGNLRLNFTEPNADELGFTRSSLSQAAFGINPNESIGDRLRADGFTESSILRFDTRHEIAMVANVGPVKVNPFGVVRGTVYDDEFNDFSPDETDKARLWSGVGIRASTSLVRTADSVESEMLDIHRVRHVIEPSVTIFHAGTTIEREDLPIYDYGVEGLLEGSMIRLGVDQTFQTKRGGPGRWRSVDVLSLDGELVFQSDTGDPLAIGRFYDPRPELSNPGEFGAMRGVWQATDAVAFAGEIIQSFETSQLARTSIGVLVDHGALNSTSLELRSLNAMDVTFLDVVNTQQLGDKYELYASVSYDTDRGDIRRATVELARELPGVVVGFSIVHDNIQGITSFGITFEPFGFREGSLRVQGIGGTRSSSGLGG